MTGFDAKTPSIARVYDYWLGGKDNFAADRELADRMVALYPPIPQLVVENRQFLSRAVTWAANQGVSQFVDLGCGLPTVPNTHETAQAGIDSARVVYIDNDPVVLSHLNARVARNNPGVMVLDGDVRDVPALLDAIRAYIDLSQPTCLLMGTLLHFFAPDAAADLVARYVRSLAPGSHVVLSVGRGDGETADKNFNTYSTAAVQMYNYSVAEFTRFFGSLELVPPGVADARQWHPGWEDAVNRPPREGQIVVGVGRVR